MRILYLSRASSKATFDYVFNSAQNPIGHESQKFHSLVIDGLNIQNEISEILSISILPINRNTHRFNFLFIPSDSNYKVKYKYVPYIKLACHRITAGVGNHPVLIHLPCPLVMQ